MEDIEKYIFDPKNPKGFKAYGLLKILASKKNSIIFSDPIFTTLLYPKIIFDDKTNSKLWEKPSNFSELPTLKKIEIFIDNFSSYELAELLLNKMYNFNNPFYKAFNGLNIFQPEYSYYFDILNKGLDEVNSNEYNEPYHVIAFLTTRYFNLLPLKTLVSGVVFVLEEEYHELKNYDYSSNIRPIIIKEIKHLPILLQELKRDINKQKTTTTKRQFSNSYLLKSKIENYFSIKKLNFKFEGQKEIYFIGENGDGKSLLLQGILLGLIGNQKIGLISDFVKQNKNNGKLRLESLDSKGNLYQYLEKTTTQKNYANQIFAYGVNRFQNDSDRKDQYGVLTLFSHDQYLENPVKWLQHLDYQEKSGNQPDIPLDKAKQLLKELLEENVKIEVSPDGVDFHERGTKLKFEQLSDGYKSVLVWMCDLLSRLAAKQPDVAHISDFHGIVLVDEIGMFLHPKWQRTIVKKLRTTFPNIQFFFTTHSPIVLLGASEDAIFYKVYKEDGETKVSDPIENKSLGHLMANGILTAPFLFGLESAANEVHDNKNGILDTSEDYLTGKIHEAISARIADKNNISEENILDLIQKELDKYEAQATND